MWLHLLSLSAAVSAVNAMCFGAPGLQQPVDCPATMVYYSQLCICLEPKHRERLNEIGPKRKVPIMSNPYMATRRSMKDKLEALRHRLTVSLPDMSSSYAQGSSVGEVTNPLILFPDRHYLPTKLASSTVFNQMPRSWRVGGLLEAWSRDAFRNGQVPTVSTGVFRPPTSSWDASQDQLSSLSLLERLHTLRNLWRAEAQSAAERQLGNRALAEKFIKRLPVTGIAPDTSRRNFHIAGGFPGMDQSMLKQRTMAAAKVGSEVSKMPMSSLKAADLIKQGLDDILPKETAKRANSYLRSAMRLKAAGEG